MRDSHQRQPDGTENRRQNHHRTSQLKAVVETHQRDDPQKTDQDDQPELLLAEAKPRSSSGSPALGVGLSSVLAVRSRIPQYARGRTSIFARRDVGNFGPQDLPGHGRSA